TTTATAYSPPPSSPSPPYIVGQRLRDAAMFSPSSASSGSDGSTFLGVEDTSAAAASSSGSCGRKMVWTCVRVPLNDPQKEPAAEPSLSRGTMKGAMTAACGNRRKEDGYDNLTEGVILAAPPGLPCSSSSTLPPPALVQERKTLDEDADCDFPARTSRTNSMTVQQDNVHNAPITEQMNEDIMIPADVEQLKSETIDMLKHISDFDLEHRLSDAEAQVALQIIEERSAQNTDRDLARATAMLRNKLKKSKRGVVDDARASASTSETVRLDDATHRLRGLVITTKTERGSYRVLQGGSECSSAPTSATASTATGGAASSSSTQKMAQAESTSKPPSKMSPASSSISSQTVAARPSCSSPPTAAQPKIITGAERGQQRDESLEQRPHDPQLESRSSCDVFQSSSFLTAHDQASSATSRQGG
ncbi:unnamed protein product, partial [Amoebophrya sp. A120]